MGSSRSEDQVCTAGGPGVHAAPVDPAASLYGCSLTLVPDWLWPWLGAEGYSSGNKPATKLIET